MNSFNIPYTKQLLESYTKRSHFVKNIPQKMNTFKALSPYPMFHKTLPRSQVCTNSVLLRYKFLHFGMGLAHNLFEISCTKKEKHVSYKVIMNSFNIQYTKQLLED